MWAIGTGLTATPEIAQGVHAHVRSLLADKYGDAIASTVRIQYGERRNVFDSLGWRFCIRIEAFTYSMICSNTPVTSEESRAHRR